MYKYYFCYLALILTAAYTLFAQVSGQTTLTDTGASTGGSLLKGCTVSSTNVVQTCSGSYPPAGWTQIDAQGFENGRYNSGESAFGSNSVTINCGFGHTGNCSQDSFITQSFRGYGVLFNGNNINSRTVYVSYWLYTNNSNPGFGHSYTNWYRCVRALKSQGVGFGLDFDDTPNTGVVNDTTAQWALYGNTTSETGWAIYAGTTTEPVASWHQYECSAKMNDPFQTNASATFYLDGNQVYTCSISNNCPSVLPGKFDGDVDYTTADFYVGGDWGADYFLVNNQPPPAGCSTKGDLGQGTGTMNMSACQCTGQCLPGGTIPFFHIYIDDIIILKK